MNITDIESYLLNSPKQLKVKSLTLSETNLILNDLQNRLDDVLHKKYQKGLRIKICSDQKNKSKLVKSANFEKTINDWELVGLSTNDFFTSTVQIENLEEYEKQIEARLESNTTQQDLF